MSDVPRWLASFQEHFGTMLRSPLDRSRGTLRARPETYPGELAQIAVARTSSGRERLAVYNRQYWFRLFGVLAGAFPLTARLLGHWRFNGHAATFLEAHPPRSFLIDHVSEGFADFLAALAPTLDLAGLELDRATLIEGVRIDDAWRMAHYSVLPPSWRLTPAEAARVPSSRLRPSPAVHIVDESWPLVDLRGRIVEDDGEDPVPIPPRHDHPRAWAVVRRPSGVGALPLAPLEGVLFRLLRRYPVAQALAELEASCPAAELPSLPQSSRLWLMRSVELGFWIGLEDDASSPTQK